jgi:ribosomal protein S18 acetylase RimI-like enzyme
MQQIVGEKCGLTAISEPLSRRTAPSPHPRSLSTIVRACFGRLRSPIDRRKRAPIVLREGNPALGTRTTMAIRYTDDAQSLAPPALQGFFVGWLDPPTPQRHAEILRSSYKVWLAFDGDRCVGFINAISDGVFCAHVPLLEVLPEYQGRGIGSQLVQRMVGSLEDMYAIDVVCDEAVSGFYEKLGFVRLVAMVKRDYGRQSAAPPSSREPGEPQHTLRYQAE